MKKVIPLTLALLLLFPVNLYAQDLNNNFEIKASNMTNHNSENLSTLIYTYRDTGSNLFFPSELSLFTAEQISENSNQKYNIFDLSFYQSLDSKYGENQFGLGIKSFNKNEIKAETSGYGLKLSVQNTQELSDKLNLSTKAELTPIGKYTVKSKDLNYDGDLSTYALDLGLVANLSNTFNLKGGYLLHTYKFGSDSVKDIAAYQESFTGLYLGGEILF